MVGYCIKTKITVKNNSFVVFWKLFIITVLVCVCVCMEIFCCIFK